MKYSKYTISAFFGGILLCSVAEAVPVVFSDKATFQAAAGVTTTYGFETHGTIEGFGPIPAPVLASDLDNNFQLDFTNLNGFGILDNATADGVVDGTHYLFTHSQISPSINDYTLTFSDFGAAGASITAFGLTITDFASNITTPSSITYDAGGLTGTLLSVPAGQPEFTQNFLGLTVSDAEAFTSITLTFDDNTSGFQDFDQVIYSTPTDLPEPGTLALMGFSVLGLRFLKRKSV